MNRKKLFLILMLMAISLVGITVMQVIWLNNTIKANEENFNRIVNESLSAVVEKLSMEKSLYFASQKVIPVMGIQTQSGSVSQKAPVKSTMHNKGKHSKGVSQLVTVKVGNGISSYAYTASNETVDSLEHIIHKIGADPFLIGWENIKETRVITKEMLDSIRSTFEKKIIRMPAERNIAWTVADAKGEMVYLVRSDSTQYTMTITNTGDLKISNSDQDSISGVVILDNSKDLMDITQEIENNIKTESVDEIPEVKHITRGVEVKNQVTVQVDAKDLAKREEQHSKAIDQLVFEMDAMKIKLEDRVDPVGVGMLLKSELENRGLHSSFDYALTSEDSVRRVVYASPGFDQTNREKPYRTNLFPKNIIPLNDFLEVTFPDKNYTIYKSVLMPISASGFFTLIILLTFTITLITILRQKKLAEMKADFINNMTHELKTPIATINLATDSIDNPKVVEKPDSVKYFTSIIREENTRMNKLVESVLQTARLERKTLKLNLKEVDMVDLINKVAKQISVQVADKSGILHLDIPTEPVIMNLDEHLMENVIFNLVDNALKYCDKSPLILITLKTLPGGIAISVEDNGIGISKGDQNKVFEKFYRVPQGDVHNVKGFGLGLSNVKEITELHGGMVQLRSELGKGSTFTLYFPFKPNGDE